MPVYLPGRTLTARILNITYKCKNVQYITSSTTQLCQFIVQCRSRHTLSLIIEETHVVGTR